MKLPSLVSGTLLRRYKRFLADVKLDDGSIVTAHCPNTGSMRGCSEPGLQVFLSRHDVPSRKYPFTWQLIRLPGTLVGVNTMNTNRLVREALEGRRIKALSGYSLERGEPVVASGSRLDFLLNHPQKGRLYVEAKNCTLVQSGKAAFPDAVTTRGQKHLGLLTALQKQGAGAAIVFLVQREDAQGFQPADDIDPEYGRLLRAATSAGVQVLAHACHVSQVEILLGRQLPVIF